MFPVTDQPVIQLGAIARYPDDAYRCSDIIRQMIVDGYVGKWVAIRLSDGGSDKIAYDTKADAIRHQLHELLCCYVLVPNVDMTPRAAWNYLRLHRQLYDAGYHLVDPDKEVVFSQRSEDMPWNRTR